MSAATASRLATPSSREGSMAPSSSTPQGTTTDLYRPIANAVSKPLAPLLTSDTGLPSVLNMDVVTYNARLSGKTVMLTDIPSTADMGASIRQGKADATINAAPELGRRQHRKHMAVTGRQNVIDYQSIVPIHYLHVRYMAQLCALPTTGVTSAPSTSKGPSLLPGVSPEGLQSKLVKADFTGAKLEVRSARNRSLAGIMGIVVEETAGSFRLVGTDSVTRVVPKGGTQFTLRFPAYAPATSWEAVDMVTHIATTPQVEIDILGSSFAYRSGDRAGRKFRPAQGRGGGSGWGEDFVQGEWSGLVRAWEDRGAIMSKHRKRGKSRRKDPLAGGNLQL